MPDKKKTKLALAAIFVVVIVASVVMIARGTPRATVAPAANDLTRYAEVPPLAQASSTAALVAHIGTTTVPILVYHIVRPSYPDDSPAVRRLAQTPEVFDAQLHYLATAGYTVISFAALEAHVRNAAHLPPHPIIISFDDGWRDQFDYAFPILKKYNDAATFFVFTNAIGKPSFFSWDNLKTMRDAGMTIGSHSVSHPFLKKITDPAVLWNEISGSKKILEKNLGITVNEFAYPFGQYNDAIIALVKKAGYASARGDYIKDGSAQPLGRLYTLSALNAPTTTARFMQEFKLR